MSRLTKWENENAVLFDYEYEEMKDKFYTDNDVVDCVNLEFALEKLAEYEDLEEKGLLPKFHLGDEFWTVRFSGATKEKIVMLQQKKDGTWKYRFPNTCDYEESDYGKYFFDTKDEAEKFWEERYGGDK